MPFLYIKEKLKKHCIHNSKFMKDIGILLWKNTFEILTFSSQNEIINAISVKKLIEESEREVE